MFNQKFITLILAAGGSGLRLGSPMPKQYLPLNGLEIALHSFHLFSSMEEIDEIIVVAKSTYHHLFTSSKSLSFALPGKRRQDSVYSGFLAASKKSKFIAVHDAARPFVQKEDVLKLLEVGTATKAAALALPVTSTIKIADVDGIVEKTLDRSKLFEIQTPQILSTEIFQKGMEYVHKNNLEVTDEASIAELIGMKVALVKASPKNIKITTPLDLQFANFLCAIN